MAIPTNLNNMSREQLIAHIAQMQAASQQRLTLKVGEKGTVCLYGLGRYPVALYASQWERLLGQVDAIRAFCASDARNEKTGAAIARDKAE